MTQSKNRLTAMTAIAAVLALATPAIAQDAQPAPVSTPDPLSATPPTVEPEPSTTTVDPLSASPTVETAPAPAPATKARTTPRRATRAAPTPVRSATPARSTPRPVAAPTAPASPAPVEAVAPLAAPIVAATPPVVAAPAPVQPEAPPAESASSDVLPIAAAGGLGLLALLGAAMVLRRRKRRAEEDECVAYDEPAFEEPRVPVAFEEPMREPSMTRAPVMAAPVVAAVPSQPLDAPANTLPDGFDLSRFGPHVQAAYRGPTDDNPSLSLKNRLRRASAMDQMVRTDGEPAQAGVPRPLATSTSARDTGAVVSKLRTAPNTGGFILGGDTPRPKPRPVTHH